MNYQDWLASVPTEITGDALWRMEVYRLALFAGDLAWHDATRLMQDKRTLGLSDQLYEAVGSVGANISEGYGRSSHRDQARFYEYSLGSAREARTWYFKARHVLGETAAIHRIKLTTQIIKHLLNIIPAQRGYALREEPPAYLADTAVADLSELLANVPMPPTAA
jgi:four helix bundle protein